MADIQVKGVFDDSGKLSKIDATGKMKHIINDSERYLFNIGTNSELKEAVGRYFGKNPDNAWVHSPAALPACEDLYELYGWDQVKTTIKPDTTEILDVAVTPTILATKQLINDSDKKATFSAKISENVSNTVAMQWSSNVKMSVEQNISYKFLGIGGSTKFGFELGFGSNRTMTQATTVGMETAVSVELEPGEKVIVELSANSGKMKARITYKVRLKGGVACNYDLEYKEHHYWKHPIGNVLGSGESVKVFEDIEIGFYSNATARIINGDRSVREIEAFIRAESE